MKMDCRFLCMLGLLALCSADGSRPSNAQCLSDSECAQGECCVYLPGKDGVTSCAAVGRRQERCRPGGVANHTLSDRGEPTLRATALAHYALCPCAIGLACSREGVCTVDVPYGSESHPAQVPVKP